MFVATNMRNLHRTSVIILTSFLLLVLIACAKIGSPLGGPVDEDPPVVIKTTPLDSSVNYSPKKNIEITFDEFIQLEDIYQELIISPPLDEKPAAQLKGKSIVVQFPRDAKFDTTTYTISFGNSIVDNNEGNVLRNYEFVFSLKDYIDSMNVEGRVINAFNHTPDEERMFVMLYKNLNDSAPLLEKPSYISRTNEEGYFSLHNLETGHYRLFALKDANSNLMFDLPGEQIAFHDSIIELTSDRFKDNIIIRDSTLAYLINQQDSVVTDSTLSDSLKKQPSIYSYNTQMVSFTQLLKNQYMVDYLRKEDEQLFFTFNESLSDTFHIHPVNFQPSGTWYLLDANKTRDTLIYWLTDTNAIGMDSIRFEVTFPIYDSLGILTPFTDTLLLISQAREEESLKPRRSKKKEKENDQTEEEIKPVKKLMLSNNIKNTNAFDLDKKIGIITKTPCFDFNADKIHLYLIQDTLEIPQKFTAFKDTNSLYRIYINYQPEELTSYKVVIYDSALSDIYGTGNDTTIFNFKTQSSDYYGILTINLLNIKSPVILQLMNEKEIVLSQKFFASDQRIRYEYMIPKKYKLKVIIDSNDNGKWDTGNYLKKIQPEKVIYFPQEINVRSNWEIDYSWPLNY